MNEHNSNNRGDKNFQHDPTQTNTVETDTRQEQRVLRQTVEEFLRGNPCATVFMTTPGGYVYLDPTGIDALLNGGNAYALPGALNYRSEVAAEELLPQYILRVYPPSRADDAFGLFTIMPDEEDEYAEASEKPSMTL